MLNILIIGAGGREHALAWKFAQDARVQHIYVAPGNAGTANMQRVRNIPLTRVSDLLTFAKQNDIGLTFVGAEALLVEGIVDTFQAQGLTIFGPDQQAAQLEGSKRFAKDFMHKYGVKTAAYAAFHELDAALAHLHDCPYPTVVKASGLAAGKGVVICQNQAEAEAAVRAMMEKRRFGEAGAEIDILEPTLRGIQAEGMNFAGVIFFGLMVTARGVYLLEYNMRFGDPETQAVLPLLDSELLDAVQAALDRRLDANVFRWKDAHACCVVAASKGYPGDYRTGLPIHHLEQARFYAQVFIAGAKYSDGQYLTSGGRVLNLVGVAQTAAEARQKAYDAIARVQFDGITWRRDIGA